MGMVNMDTGAELYMVFNDFDTRRVAKDWWLMENVMSSIDHEKFVVADFEGSPVLRDIYVTDKAAVSRDQGAALLQDFVQGDTDIEWWNWYGAYDHLSLCQLFGKMIDLPKGFPMYSNDIKQIHKQSGYCQMPKQPSGKHNALDDARFNVVRYDYIMDVLSNQGQPLSHPAKESLINLLGP